MRFFNTAGPVNCNKNYCLPPLSRFDLPDILSLITQEKYFVLHAPRQSGKTSCLLALRDHLNQGGIYTSLYINVESGQTARGDVGRGIKAILSELALQADRTLGDATLRNLINSSIKEYGEDAALKTVLSDWCHKLKKPLVLSIDEVDALVGDTLISLLRQIRSGYPERPVSFPVSNICVESGMFGITASIQAEKMPSSPEVVPSISKRSHSGLGTFLKKRSEPFACSTPPKPARYLKKKHSA